jgi:hypothetical protein
MATRKWVNDIDLFASREQDGPVSNAIMTASERLVQRVPMKDPSSCGISYEETANIQVDEQVRADILSCLYDVNPSEVRWGLWFCESLLMAGKLDDHIENALIQQIPSLLKSEDPKLRGEVVRVVVKLRGQLPEYRDWMLQCLRDSYSSVRNHALLNSQTFLKPKEIEPLLAFEKDDYLTETSMGSPLVYLLRNEALDRIEKSLGKTFQRQQLSEVVKGGETAYWRDWKPFLDWRNNHWGRWCFWRAR